MPRLIKDGGIIDDSWRLISSDDIDACQPLSSKLILPLSLWLRLQPQFDGFETTPGVWIEGNQELDVIDELIPHMPLIAVRFSAIADGSGYSTGSLLREVYGFGDELRAFGSLMIDQATYLRRCGYNAIALDSGQQLEDALQLLINAGLTYQGSVFSPRTPFKFRYGRK
ncbi:MAG: DUF934 domain-containing protein [Halopseudomonas sp.]